MKKKTAQKSYDLYYFDSINDVNLEKIDGNALILIGEKPVNAKARLDTSHPDPQSKIEIENTISGKVGPDKNQKISTAYFVKDHQYATAQGIEWRFDQRKLIFMQDNRDANTRKVSLIKDRRNIEDDLALLAEHAGFPYTKAIIYFSHDAATTEIKIRRDDNFVDATDHDNIDPVAKEYLHRKNEPNYNLLTFLYAIKANSEQSSMKLMQEGARASQAVTVDHMINQVREKNKSYLNFNEVKERINYIEHHLQGSKLAKQKNKILDDFRRFYAENLDSTSMLSRSVLVEAWVNQYIKNNNN